MIGTSAILHEDFYVEDTLTQARFFREEKKEEVFGFADLELLVTDSETGKPISKAMISIDSISRTAVCDVQGKVLIHDLINGRLMVDVIVYGYIAHSSYIQLSAKQTNMLNVKMVSNS